MAEQSNRIQFLKDALKNLSSAVREVSNGLIDLEKVISRLSGKTREFAKEQQTAAQSVNRVGKNLKDTAKTVDDYGKNTEKASKSQKGLFGGLRKNLRTIVQFYGAYQVLNLAISAFRELVIGSARRAIALEKSLADLRAVAGLTAEDVSRLKDVVFEVAGATSLTSTEVVSLQKELAKLGTSVTDIENLTLPIALLSQALGEDAGGVAATLKKTLNQFQATSTESERFANILLGAVNETALSLTDLGTALGYVGPLGAQLGVSFEETAALLGILADNGFKASKAGTGLRSFFIAAAKDGRPFNEFLEDVGNRSLDATEAVQTFGKIAASQALVLGENVDKYKELSKELQDSTRLLKANADQMASTQGQIDILSSAYDKLSTKIGDSITKTEFFLKVIALLDREASATAKAYKVISDATDEQKESIDNIILSLREFNNETKGTDGELIAVSEAFDLLGLSLEGIDKDKFLADFNKELKNTGDIQESLVNVGETWNDVSIQTAINLKELINILYLQSKSLDDTYIAQEANSASVKRYKEEYQGLLSLTREGINVDKEKSILTKQIDKEISALQKASFKAAADRDFEQQTIIVKRIELLKEQKEEIEKLSVSEETLAEQRKRRDKEAQQSFEKDLASYIERIKETEKAISELPEGVSDKLFTQQVDLLTGFFGSAEDIIAQATKRFGPDSKFVKALIETLKKASEKVSVELPEGLPETKNTLDLITSSTLDTINFIKNNLSEFEKIKLGDVIGESLETAAGAISDFNDTALENTRNRLDAEKSSIENRYQVEQDILKSQLDNQLITESQFRQKQRELQKAKVAEENAIDKQIFDSEKKRDRQNASTDYLQAIASIIPTLIAYDKTADPVSVLTKAAITGALATAAYGAELAAIGQRKFFPKKFEQGGVVSGPSHSQGGVPFSVQGQGGYEMEGGEYIINKRATAMHKDLLDRINGTYNTSAISSTRKFNNGGLVRSQLLSPNIRLINNQEPTRVVVEKESDESVDYLKAIAEATTSTAIGVSKPVRAYVSDKDLRTNATERRIRDRNDRL